MKSDELGSLLTGLLLTAGMLSLPELSFCSLEGVFVTAWTALCILVFAAFWKNLFPKG